MEELLNQFLTYLDYNIYLTSFIIIICLNTFLPGSLVIIFFVGLYGFYQGVLYSYIILILASSIPFFILNILKVNPLKVMSILKVERFFEITTKISIRSSILIRLTSIPFLVQNILCSIIEKNYVKYLTINVISLFPWMIGFGLFAESLANLRFEFLILSLIIIFIFYYFLKRNYREFF